MANVIATGSELQVNVTTTDNIITITDVESNVIVSNITNAVTTVTVENTELTVNVAPLTSVSNASIRNALSVDDTGGYGSLSYSNLTGVFTFVGTSDANIRESLSVVDSGGDGAFSYDSANGIFTYRGPSASEVRSHFSATANITYDSGSGVIGQNLFTQDVTEGDDLYYTTDRANTAIDAYLPTAVLNGNLTLKQYQETVASDLGNINGSLSFDMADGTVFSGTLIADITSISIANVQPGSSATVLLTQDATIGAWVIDDTSLTNWTFINDEKDPQPGVGTTSVLNIFYDGTTYYGSVLRGDAPVNSVTYNGVEVALGASGNLVTANIAEDTNLYYTTDRANTAIVTYLGDAANGPFTINGDLEVQGNIDYVNVEDLLVNDQSITLNYGNASARNAFIYIDRSGSALNNAHIKWNELSDQWEIYDGSSTYVVPRTTSDLTEGTNLYWTTARGNAAINDYLIGGDGIDITTGNISVDATVARTNTNVQFSDLTAANITATGDLLVNGLTTLESNVLITGDKLTLGNSLVAPDIYTNGSINLSSSGADINMSYGKINMTNVASTANAISTTGKISTSSNVHGQWFVGNVSGSVGNLTTVNATTVNATTVNATTLTGNVDSQIGVYLADYDIDKNIRGDNVAVRFGSSSNASTGNGYIWVSGSDTNQYSPLSVTGATTPSAVFDSQFIMDESNSSYGAYVALGSQGYLDIGAAFDINVTSQSGNVVFDTSPGDYIKFEERIIANAQINATNGSLLTSNISGPASANLSITGWGNTEISSSFGNVILDVDTAGKHIYIEGATGSKVISGIDIEAPNFIGNVTLANTGVTADTYGNATYVPQITVDADGRISSATNVAISGVSANSFGIISVSGQSNVEADIPTDQLTLVAGSGMSITTDAANDSITLTSTGGYGNADVQNFLENGYGSANITTTGDITAGTFTGDGSDLTSVRAETIEITIKNAEATANIAKGMPVHAIGTATGGEVEVVLADAGNAQLMPAHFIANETIAVGDPGRGILSGRIFNVDTSSFSVGDTIFVAVGGGYANVAPSGEANLIQNLGVVTDVAVSGAGEVYGAGRAAATPNLDDGALFVGSSANKAIAVDTTNNFDVSDTEFDLANALSNVNSITSEASTNLTLNTDTLLSVTQNVNGQDIYAANIKSSGYALQVGGLGTWAQDRTKFDYSGSANLTALYFEGNIVAGSNQITDVANVVRWNDNDANFSLANVQPYMVVGGDSPSDNTQATPFPQGTYVTAVDVANTTVTFSANALANVTLDSSNPMVFWPGAVDTNTGLAILLEPEAPYVDTANIGFAVPLNIVYGYPASGPANTDFNYSYGTSSDYTLGDSSNYTMAKISQEAPNSTFNNRRGIIIGESGDMSNRGYQDAFQSFGLNILWDGNTPTDSYNELESNPINQILMRQWTDNNFQSTNNSGGGPRLFFASNYGKESDLYSNWYARANQELGRLSFWSSNERQSVPSSITVPAFISVQAANDYDSANSVSGVGGNADVYFGAISDAVNVGSTDIYLAYQGGKLTLGGGSSKEIQFAPAQSTSGASPQSAYSSTYNTIWANVNYANTSATTGSKFTVTNSGSAGAGVVGDMQLSVKRVDNSGNTTVNITTPFGGGTTFLANGDFGNTGDTITASPAYVGLADGDAITIGNMTGSYGTFFNGNTYYVKYFNLFGSFDSYELYSTPDLAVANAVVSGEATGVSGGDISYYLDAGVTAKEYVFNLTEQSDDLELTVDATTAVTFHSNTDVTFAGNITYTNQTDGTVTSVDSGAGLTGGPITTSGTLAVGAGYGITVNADDIELDNVAVQAQANAALAAGGIVNATLGSNNIWLGSGGSIPTETSFDSALSTNITNTNVALKRFNETVETTANVSGAVSFDVANGSIFKANVTGDITSLALTNATAGTSATLILTQGATTGTLTAGASWLWAGGTKTLSTTTGDVDIISVVYDGTNYYASLTTGYVT